MHVFECSLTLHWNMSEGYQFQRKYRLQMSYNQTVNAQWATLVYSPYLCSISWTWSHLQPPFPAKPNIQECT